MMPETFGQRTFGAAKLGHPLRTKRLVHSADAILHHPHGTLPDKLAHPADLKGFYRLMNRPEVTHDALLAPACAGTRRLVATEPGVVLLIEDWTELDFTGLESLADQLGLIGNGSHKGLLCATCLAVRPRPRQVLGLIGQRLARRRRVPKTRTRTQRRDDPHRETRLWSQLSRDLPVTTATDRCVVVADRGADVLEFLDALVAAERSFLIRATHNRRIDLADGRRTRLLDYARTRPGVGERALAIAATQGRSARSARLAVAFAAVSLVMPVQPRGEVRGVPLAVRVVRVWEPDPPAGVEGLEWVLVTDRAIESAAGAWELVGWYECRWEVEEFHKGLKTGCDVEALQFTSLAALEPTIGLLSVLAVELLRVRDAARDPVQSRRLAWEWVGELAVRVLSLWRHRAVRMDWSVAEYCWALARLGGHQNRVGDGPPGWQTLWKGQMKLQSMLQLAAAIQDTNSTRQPGQT